ncbi:MAG: hypothetical protein ACYCSB_02075 [bacterium]
MILLSCHIYNRVDIGKSQGEGRSIKSPLFSVNSTCYATVIAVQGITNTIITIVRPTKVISKDNSVHSSILRTIPSTLFKIIIYI